MFTGPFQKQTLNLPHVHFKGHLKLFAGFTKCLMNYIVNLN